MIRDLEPATRRDAEVAAQFAEVILSSGYRQAMTTAFDTAPDTESFFAERSEAELLIASTLRTHNDPERAWEQRRLATLTELGGTGLGGFNDYFQSLGGESTPSSLTPLDIEKASPEIVRTNSQILGLNRVHEEPIDFMTDALEVIARQRKSARGPGNYATALKFFTDKYENFPSSHLDKELVKKAVDRCMSGFVAVAEDNHPNFIEMTNIYYAIRALPAGTFDKKFTEYIVGHSLAQLPTYHSATLSLMIASMSKLDLSESGESAATLLDLGLRKTSAMERTTNMVQALRSIANLPASPAAERAFATFLDVRNNLEQPQELEGLNVINYALVHIVKNVIADPELSQQAKSLAERCATISVGIVRHRESLGDTTAEEIEGLRTTVRRIIYNYNQI